VLNDGSIIYGKGFGYPRRIIGEVVFNTGMVGYTEAMTDPSYRGQILTFTYPLIGNYGVPSYKDQDGFGLPNYFESNNIQSSGMIVSELCNKPSHWRSVKTVDKWLYDEGIPGIFDVDTRSLTIKIREHGVMMGALEVSKESMDVDKLVDDLTLEKNYDEQKFIDLVSVKDTKVYGESENKVVLIDCGVKNGIIRELLKRGLQVIRVPYNTSSSEILSHNPRGVLVSNGPGNPKICSETVAAVKELVLEKTPILGICLGVQILALALGGSTFKLRYGHRGQNKPCVELDTGKSYVTSQNHGYAVDAKLLKNTGLNVWFINADDKTVEGVYHQSKPCFAVQFHPEASPGPNDTTFIFDKFCKKMGIEN